MINRITQDRIDELMQGPRHVWVVPGTTTTVVAITLDNGYTVIGHSACIDPAQFDPDLGVKIALEEIEDQLWGLEGYAAMTINAKEGEADGDR